MAGGVISTSTELRLPSKTASMRVAPIPTAVTMPPGATVATLLSWDVHSASTVRSRLVPFVKKASDSQLTCFAWSPQHQGAGSDPYLAEDPGNWRV